MKKVLFAILAICSFGIISCEKNIEPIAPQDNDSKLVKMTFSASTPGTRTAIGNLSGNEYSVTWSEGDQIRVIAVDANGVRLENENEVFDIDAASVGSDRASFTGTSVEGAAAYYAVYPASLDATINGTGDNATVSLSGFASHSVEAVAGGFDPSRAVMFAAADGSSFAFKHGMIYFKVTVSCANVSSIELSCKDSNTRIYGNPTYHFIDGSIDNNIGEASKDNNYIELAPSSGTLIQGNAYYIPVIAKNSTFGTLTLTYTDGNGVKIAKKTSKLSNIKPVNGTVYDLGTPPVSFEPSLTILKNVVDNIPYTAETGLVIENAYRLYIYEDSDVSVSVDGTVVTSASIADGNVTFSVSANSGDAREGWIGLNVTDGDVKTITIEQVANGEATEIVPVTETTTWDATNTWKPLKQEKGANAVKEDFLFNNLGFVNGNGSGFKFADDRVQLAGSGAAGTKCCLQFKVGGPGVVTITCHSGNTSNDRTLKVALGSVEKGDISAPAGDNNTESITLSDASSGDVVNIYSGGSGINVFSITWTPAS